MSRTQIAQAACSTPAADHKTFELIAERGAAQHDRSWLFAALEADPVGSLDAVQDRDDLPEVLLVRCVRASRSTAPRHETCLSC